MMNEEDGLLRANKMSLKERREKFCKSKCMKSEISRKNNILSKKHKKLRPEVFSLESL